MMNVETLQFEEIDGLGGQYNAKEGSEEQGEWELKKQQGQKDKVSIEENGSDGLKTDLNSDDMKGAISSMVQKLGLFAPSGREAGSVPACCYYGVYIPPDAALTNDEVADILHVYTEKTEALKVMKHCKKARFKQFKSRSEAVSFAAHGAELSAAPGSSCANGGSEKAIPFKGPKTQDMIKFRKAIECGDLAVVKKLVWENPRYLVSSGDTPSILQEGSRYNALHVGAKAQNADMCRLILDTVSNVQFISRLYDDQDLTSCQSRLEVLLDLYLNMPDKGLNETPLHFAAKYGALEVVALLVTYPQCQRGLLNKYQHSVKDMVCSRVQNECKRTKEGILGLLEEQFFVPVLRYEDNSMQPRVGDPFSPTLSPKSPLNIKEDPLSPRLEIQAYAGPMNKADAENMKKKWRTPMRCPKNLSFLKMVDTEKGLECIGRNLAAIMEVPWKEYWSFLDTFADFSTPEGLKLLEGYLKNRFNETLLEVSHCDEPASLSPAGLLRDSSSPLSPISDLCVAFNACCLNDAGTVTTARPLVVHRTSTPLASDKTTQKSVEVADDLVVTTESSPSVYLERSCQVFAKRMATAVYAVLASSADIYEMCTESLIGALYSEARHLRSLVLSYLQDSRFHGLDVSSIHGRVVSTAADSLREQISTEETALLMAGLPQAVEVNSGRQADEDTEARYNCRPAVTQSMTDTLILRQHVSCILKILHHKLTLPSICPEDPRDCTCDWSGRSSPKARGLGNKRTLGARYTVPDGPATARKIIFHCDKLEEMDDALEFCTPPGSPRHSDGESDSSTSSDAEEMEDPCEFPDTYIYPGDTPSKTDVAVLDAIGSASSHITPESYPNLYRWRHLVQLALSNHKTPMAPVSPGAWHRRLPNSNFKKHVMSDDELTPIRTISEPWERVAGTMSPRRRHRSNSETSASPLTR